MVNRGFGVVLEEKGSGGKWSSGDKQGFQWQRGLVAKVARCDPWEGNRAASKWIRSGMKNENVSVEQEWMDNGGIRK